MLLRPAHLHTLQIGDASSATATAWVCIVILVLPLVGERHGGETFEQMPACGITAMLVNTSRSGATSSRITPCIG